MSETKPSACRTAGLRARLEVIRGRTVATLEAYDAELLEMEERFAAVDREARALRAIELGAPMPMFGARGWFFPTDERAIFAPHHKREISTEQRELFMAWLSTPRGLGAWPRLADAVLEAANATGMEV